MGSALRPVQYRQNVGAFLTGVHCPASCRRINIKEKNNEKDLCNITGSYMRIINDRLRGRKQLRHSIDGIDGSNNGRSERKERGRHDICGV